MLKIFIYFCCIVTLTQTQNFPTHTDLQKLGIVHFKGDKYTVLKPSVHVIKDYFKDYVLKQQTVGIPSAKVFLDHNGLRHYWTSFVEDSQGKTVERQLKATENRTASARSGTGLEQKTTFLCPLLGVISTTHYQEPETRRRHHKKKHHKKHHH